MDSYFTGTDIVFVKETMYKPFWLDRHMYFVNFITGELFKQTPIYLGCSEVADISQLINYFQTNEVKFLDAREVIK